MHMKHNQNISPFANCHSITVTTLPIAPNLLFLYDFYRTNSQEVEGFPQPML